MKVVRYVFYCFLFFFYTNLQSVEHWIIIHGTFSSNNTWHAAEGETQQALKKSLAFAGHKLGSFHVHSFVWSGQNNHKARLKAAIEFKDFLKILMKDTRSSSKISFHIIGHSHGATVALLAAQMFTKEKDSPFITELFCLGIPIHISWYQDAHKKVKRIFNLFSYGDGVQSLGGVFDRVFPATIPAHNMQVIYDFECPRHTQLHDPKLIAHLPYFRLLEKYLNHPVALHVRKKENGEHAIYLLADQNREKDLATDKAFMHQIMGLYAETRAKFIKKNHLRMKEIN